MKDIFLTGIKPTGEVHIGNYFGAIKPCLEQMNNENNSSYLFIADYHALNSIKDKMELRQNTFNLACAWLGAGLDPDKVVFYKQSDIIETFELNWILNNVTPKGLINRAHAYKAMVEKNKEQGIDEDGGINMGLYCYPVLMASDILLFNSNKVPVGIDQKQHVEITRDIAKYFNNTYEEVLTLPVAVLQQNASTVLGTDGRKMSKSYGNVIPLFCSEQKLEKIIKSIKTDSSLPQEPKGTDNLIFDYYKLFSTEVEIKVFETKLKEGISWADAKKILFDKINSSLAPMREKYNFYQNNPQLVLDILKKGSEKARVIAQSTLDKVRKAIM